MNNGEPLYDSGVYTGWMIESAAHGHVVPPQGYRERQGHSEWEVRRVPQRQLLVADVAVATSFLSGHIGL